MISNRKFALLKLKKEETQSKASSSIAGTFPTRSLFASSSYSSSLRNNNNKNDEMFSDGGGGDDAYLLEEVDGLGSTSNEVLLPGMSSGVQHRNTKNRQGLHGASSLLSSSSCSSVKGHGGASTSIDSNSGGSSSNSSGCGSSSSSSNSNGSIATVKGSTLMMHAHRLGHTSFAWMKSLLSSSGTPMLPCNDAPSLPLPGSVTASVSVSSSMASNSVLSSSTQNNHGSVKRHAHESSSNILLESNSNAQKKVLLADIRVLEMLAEETFLDIVCLRELHAQAEFSQTLMGRILRFFGHALSLVAALRLIAGVTKSLTRPKYSHQNITTPTPSTNRSLLLPFSHILNQIHVHICFFSQDVARGKLLLWRDAVCNSTGSGCFFFIIPRRVPTRAH